MTTLKQLEYFLAGWPRSFSVRAENRPDISLKNTPPRSMTEAEKEYYAIHKNLKGCKP
jgi:hypothetical protein